MAGRAYNEPAEIPRELDKWNWGAFFLNWIWGLGNRTYIALLMFVPLVNIVMIFILGAKGSAWAWENKPWRDVEHFRRVQRAWAIWGLLSWIVVFGLVAWGMLSITSFIRNSEPYQVAMATVRESPEVQAALGDNIVDGTFTTGSLNYSGSSGEADLAIPVTGSTGKGNVIVRAIRTAGQWELRLLVVVVEGRPPVVLINLDNVAIPGAGTSA